MLTDTDSSATFAVAMTALVTSSAIFAFCCSDRPDASFTTTCGIVSSFLSEFLSRGPEQDFVDVHVVRLADGERDGAREGVGRNCHLPIELADPGRRVRVRHAV